MERKSKIILALVAATALGGAVAIPVLAHGTGNKMAHQMMGGAHGAQGDMMRMMMQMHSNGTMMEDQLAAFDANGDGALTPNEMKAGLQARLEKYDTDGNANLSLDEYAALFADETRNRMVDRFQALDDNGDGQVTADEFQKPAKFYRHMLHAPSGARDGGMMDGNSDMMSDG